MFVSFPVLHKRFSFFFFAAFLPLIISLALSFDRVTFFAFFSSEFEDFMKNFASEMLEFGDTFVGERVRERKRGIHND